MDKLSKLCTKIADEIVPEYRNGKKSYPCHGVIAKRWEAAWKAAHAALGCRASGGS